MNLNLDTASAEWLTAKKDEKSATERRRKLEDHLLSLIGISENLEGTENVETEKGHKIKITGRMSRKVDGERLQEIAAEAGLTEHLSSLFRWKPEINMSAWKSADKSITEPLLGGITTQPGRASFTITKE
jgi:hypothetical protein|tara:strand:+ start:1022 stop:1411 length:390 start_codon:yes stop_codon:yes gene_type:complete